jgi:hypothetical protein
MGETNHSGELGTKANGRRSQCAGMLSRSWLRFVLIAAIRSDRTCARLGLMLPREPVPGTSRPYRIGPMSTRHSPPGPNH